MMNLTAGVDFHRLRTPDKVAIVYQGQGIRYGDFHGRIMKMAGYLQARGLKQGDVIALFMKNSPAFLEISFAVSAIGAVFLPINYRLAPAEATFILENSSARLLFVDEEFEQIAALPFDRVVVDAAMQADVCAHHAVAQAVPGEVCVARPDDLVRLMYTSGTTSHPKGVMHTYSNMHWKSVDHIIALPLTGDDTLLSVGPLYHVGAFDLPGVAIFEVGGTMCLLREFNALEVLKAIQAHRVTCGWMAPVMLSRVLAEPSAVEHDLSSFRWCIAGGEKTPDTRIRDFTRVFTQGRFIDGYGMTETCSGDTLMEPGKEIEKIGSTGRALAHVQIRIMDGQGNALPADTLGEICIRGPKVTRGYWNDPQKTAESFFGDWLRSGDVGYLDEDGFLFVTDRSKDMILTGAENVASLEVEDVIFKLKKITDAAVVGVPDAQWGERVVAVVVLAPGESLTLDELAAHCAQYLASFKVPRALYLVDELPRNPSGKVLKRVVRDNLQALSWRQTISQ
ncbi:long-chain-fatty-acid--CoA ligase [Castellaniella sp.]|uniref:long-chain-fatty-acid--CoA ligase n=1 Tax=Castellaniella sp. TaxID=1955812 RepID=UPI00355CE47B